MLRNIIVSPINGFRFVPFNEPLSPLYNNQSFDKAWFIEYLKPWEKQGIYAQPVQNGDPLSLQIQVSKRASLLPFVHPKIQLIDCEGTIIKAGVFEQPAGVPTITEDGVNYGVEAYRKRDFFAGVAPGTYYLVVRAYFDPLDTGAFNVEEIMISEPLLIRPKHEGTVYLECSDKTNRDNIMFEQTRQKFGMRIHADLQLSPKSDAVVFIDQNKTPVTLSGTAFRSWEFTAGGNGHPIPGYCIDQLNHIFVLGWLSIDGKVFGRADGANLEKDAEINNPLALAKIELLERNNTDAYTHSRGGIPMLSPIPAFPFEIYKTEIGWVNQPDFFYLTPERIENTFQLNNFITGQNTLIANAGLTGTVAIEAGEMVYNRGAGENYSYAKAFVLPYRLGVRFTTTGTVAVNINIGLRAFSGQSRYSLYLPGNPAPISGFVNGSAVSNITPSYISPTGVSTQTADLYHDGTLDYFSIDALRCSGITRYNEFSLPRLRFFSISGSTALTTFNIWSELKVIRASLASLTLYNNINLANVGTYWTNDGSGSAWWELTNIILEGNKLTSAVIDSLYQNMRDCGAAGAMNIGGEMSTQMQAAGGGAATFASAMARLWLSNNFGWTFII